MLKQDVIESSTSPWASGIVLVKTKDGTTRFCVDYRKLNDDTIKDAYPLPRIDQTLDNLAGTCRFSTLYMSLGYWQFEMELRVHHEMWVISVQSYAVRALQWRPC